MKLLIRSVYRYVIEARARKAKELKLVEHPVQQCSDILGSVSEIEGMITGFGRLCAGSIQTSGSVTCSAHSLVWVVIVVDVVRFD